MKNLFFTCRSLPACRALAGRGVGFILIALLCTGFSFLSCRVVVADRPAPPVYVRPVPARPNYIWRDGDWRARRHTYHWHEGYYTAPRTNREWRAGTWKQHPKGYSWNKGRWHKANKMKSGRN
ncbi:MAG: YXWGXW repeat-containing protein [Phycisphaerae bacterium]|nr:YXWGXW repeat-containing protein [Saprospiraceae bacterium]